MARTRVWYPQANGLLMHRVAVGQHKALCGARVVFGKMNLEVQPKRCRPCMALLPKLMGDGCTSGGTHFTPDLCVCPRCGSSHKPAPSRFFGSSSWERGE